jgi:hypothetical protein
LFLAVKADDIEMVSVLANFRPNPFVKTRAGTVVCNEIKDPTISSLLMKKGKRFQENFDR